MRSATTTNLFFGWKTILKVRWLAAALAEQHHVWALEVVHEGGAEAGPEIWCSGLNTQSWCRLAEPAATLACL